MISNYNKDIESDKAIGKYNPVASGVWNHGTISEKLIQDINNNITPEISEIYTVDDALKAYWKI